MISSFMTGFCPTSTPLCGKPCGTGCGASRPLRFRALRALCGPSALLPRAAALGALASALLVAFLAVPSIEAAAEKPGSVEVIDAGPFTVAPPRGSGWEFEKADGVVTFEKRLDGPPPRLGTIITIRVLRNFPAEPRRRLSEEEAAKEFRDMEEWGMMSMGVAQGMYDLQNVKKDVATRGDKKLYYMSYRTIAPPPPKKDSKEVVSEAILYLYFPPGFAEDHFFYVFLINVACIRRHGTECGTFETDEIFPVIDSLHIK